MNAAAEDWACPYDDHPDHDPARCLLCATDEDLEPVIPLWADAEAARRRDLKCERAAWEAAAKAVQP